jgi:hypothetical protein
MAQTKFRITYATMSADNPELHEAYERALDEVKTWMGERHHFVVNGESREGEGWDEERSPIDRDIVIGEFARATVQDVNDAVAAARRFGHAHTLGHVLGLVTQIYSESGDFATLAAIGAEGEEFCDRHRLGFFGPWLRFMRLWAEAHDANRGESIAAMKDALARYEATNTTLIRAYFRGLLVRSLLTAGRLDEAAAEVEVEDPTLEAGEELEEEDFATDVDPMLETDIGAGEAEGVTEEAEQ